MCLSGFALQLTALFSSSSICFGGAQLFIISTLIILMVGTGTATAFIHFHSDPETPRRKIDDMLENIQHEFIVNNVLTVFIIQRIINLYVSSAKINAELRKCD